MTLPIKPITWHDNGQRTKELEDELSVEDIIIFRAMAEREEMLRSGSGRKGHGNRWGIGGWVRFHRIIPLLPLAALRRNVKKVEVEGVGWLRSVLLTSAALCACVVTSACKCLFFLFSTRSMIQWDYIYTRDVEPRFKVIILSPDLPPQNLPLLLR